MVGVAMYGDQPSNVNHMVQVGSGIELSYYNISEESVVWAAKTILNNRRQVFHYTIYRYSISNKVTESRILEYSIDTLQYSGFILGLFEKS